MKGTFSILAVILVVVSATIVAQESIPKKPEDSILVEFGRSAEEYYNLGNWYAERDQHVKALAYFKAALKKRPNYTEVLINMGTSYRALGRYQEAIESYRSAIDIGTDENFVHFNLGNALVSANRLREASLAFRTYIELDAYDPAGYSRLGYVLYRLGDFAEAAETFEKVLILEENDGYFLYQAARCYALMGNYDKAYEKALAALKADPNIRFVIVREEDFRDFRRSAQFQKLLAEIDGLKD